MFKQLLDHHDWDGLSFEFAIQPKPEEFPRPSLSGRNLSVTVT